MLEKIKASADAVEIPDALKPEKIERQLKRKKKQKHFCWKAGHLAAAAAMLAVVLSILPAGVLLQKENKGTEKADAAGNRVAEQREEKEQSPKRFVKKQDAGELYRIAKNEEEVKTFLEENQKRGSDTVYDMDGEKMEAAFTEGEAAGSAPIIEDALIEIGQEKLSYSGTNLQVEGVDESDFVKTDGRYIFAVSDSQVKIVDVTDGKTELAASIAPERSSFSDSVREMYVDGNKLVLIVQQCEENMDAMHTEIKSGGYLPLQEKEICYDAAYCYDNTYRTLLYTYDISDPKNPKQIGRITQDGSYRTSRKIGDVIYLFTTDSIDIEAEEQGGRADMENLLPRINDTAVSCDGIYLPKRGTQVLLISSVSTETPHEVVDNVLIFNNYVDIYVSSGAVYLYNRNYDGEEKTEIAKFILREGSISAAAAASVPGGVPDTFAIHEKNGKLYVLTTFWDAEQQENTNHLFILDKELRPEGSIRDIAVGERIYAARYVGDLVYFVTYRNTDPLFAVDLSDSKNPKILGEKKLSGYSEYLHMWGEDKLLGIGYETNPDTGERKGIKLVMFEISNPKEPEVLDTVVLKDMDDSMAMWDYKSVLADAGENIIGFSAVGYNTQKANYYVYSFEDGAFKERLETDMGLGITDKCCRGLYIGDYFYLVNEKEIRSFRRKNGYEPVSECKF